jgi:ATP adenylyltransferase/5',5'''-P-1,P-4-tetraphosphate phosphorylase II
MMPLIHGDPHLCNGCSPFGASFSLLKISFSHSVNPHAFVKRASLEDAFAIDGQLSPLFLLFLLRLPAYLPDKV